MYSFVTLPTGTIIELNSIAYVTKTGVVAFKDIQLPMQAPGYNSLLKLDPEDHEALKELLRGT